tara:strand:- start:317 stop:646 length:330 start_codon:yes stop_codon:yes gene_type:complete
MTEQLDSAFTVALEKYVIAVTPHLREFLEDVHTLPEIKTLGLPLRTILFGVIGRFHHEMEYGLTSLNLEPIEAYAYGLNKVMHDSHVNELMNSMMKTGVNAAVNNMLEM